MKVVAMIPARYDSQRFPGKLMKDLLGKSVILRTYEAAVNSGLFSDTFVVTDSDKIFNEIVSNGGKALKSTKSHSTGTDRIAEFADRVEADIIINIQGDEPFINTRDLSALIDVFKKDTYEVVDIASLMIKIDNKENFLNPNNVKVVTDTDNFAIYFSRAPIPYSRDLIFERAFKHIGVYAFRKEILQEIAILPPTDLEQVEKLENLRFIQYGMMIKMIETDTVNFGIDTEEDLIKAEEFLKKQS
jgi:3-deoxy-D-manno-octulosonate cytidylyltransferase